MSLRELVEKEVEKDIFNNIFILKWEDFINQILFEIYYNNYIKNCRKYSISSLISGDNHSNLSDNPYYKKLIRKFKKYRKYQDELSIKYNNGKDVQFKNLCTPKDCFNGHNIYEFQLKQLLILASDKYEIFNQIVKGNLGKIKNLSNYNLIQYLNTYNEIYDDINEQEDTFFKRSLQYYQLEIGNRIETWYKIIHKLTDSNFTNEEKNKY